MRKITGFFLIAVFLFCGNVSAFGDSRVFEANNLSPQLSLQLSSFQQAYLNPLTVAIPETDQKINSFDKELVEAVKRNMLIFNKSGLKKFRFDTNAGFFNKYRTDAADTSDLLIDIEKNKGGICLDMCTALQKEAYDFFTSGEFMRNIARNQSVEVEVIKAFDADYEYELKIIRDNLEYRIKGYIIGAIAGDEHRDLNAEESELLETIHYASMTKVILPNQGEEILVHEPGWGIVEGINLHTKVPGKGGSYYLEHTIRRHLDEYVQINKELAWLDQTAKGKKWIQKIMENGLTLFVQGKSKTAIRYMFIDQPLDSRYANKFLANYLITRDSCNQNIIRTDANGKRMAMAQIFIKPGNLSMKLYIADFKREVFLKADLKLIYTEIKRHSAYSEKTIRFLNCGMALGMVSQGQMGAAADESAFFKRLEVLLDKDNREDFIYNINRWQEFKPIGSIYSGSEAVSVANSI